MVVTNEVDSVAIESITGHTNRTDNPHGVTAAQLGAITNETDELALTALATNRVTRLFDDSGTRWIDGTGGVFQVVQTARPETQMTLTFSADFATAAGHAPAQRVHLFDDGQSGFRYLPCAGSHAAPNVKWTIEVVGLWGYGIVTLKHWNEANAVNFTAVCNTRDVGGNRIRPAYFAAATGSDSPYTGTIVFDDIDTPITSTNALPRVAFLPDIPSTNGLLSAAGNGSQLTGLTASQISGLPTGGSSSTLVPIVAVTTGAVTTVTWSTTPQINYIDLYTQTTITNSLPTLNCTSNMSAEVWVNAAQTNALSPVWDPRIEWQDGITPEMTCTGLYKFAFSTACGNKIQGEMKWPVPKPVINPPICVASGAGTHIYGYGLLSSPMATGGTNGYVNVIAPAPSKYYALRLGVAFSSAGAKAVLLTFSPKIVSYGYSDTLLSYTWTNVEPSNATAGFMTPWFIFPPTAGSYTAAHTSLGFNVVRAINTDTVYIREAMLREATPQEIAAYNAGVRP